MEKSSMMNEKNIILSSFITTLCVYTPLMLYITECNASVSDPGEARSKEDKIRRKPKWDNVVTNYTDSEKEGSTMAKWRCAVAKDSHVVTQTRFGLLDSPKNNGHGNENGGGSGVSEQDTKNVKVDITGEPAGRQIWTTLPRSQDDENTSSDSENKKGEKKVVVDEALVQEMACGGRSVGFNPSKNPNSCDQIFRAQQIRNYISSGQKPPSTTTDNTPHTPIEAAKKAIHFYSMLQTEDGHWAGDYGGPHFLMPGVIIAWYVMGQPEEMLDKHQREMMMHYIAVHQQSDGGWGTHIESPSTMFGTVLNYVALRLLDRDETHKSKYEKAVSFISAQGGAIMTSSWAKFWLCLLGCMEWDGHNSVPPEMWLLPNWTPFHPGRLWCHCRMVYLPMGYLYGARFVYPDAEKDPLISSLREELYIEPYESIDWIRTRHFVAPMDNYSPIPWTMEFLQNCLARYETWFIFQPFKNWVRKKALKFSVEYMDAEDLSTNYIDIGPVNKALNMVSQFHAAGNDVTAPKVKKHMMRIPDYLWLAEDGMKMQGYNGSQCWDTSFAIQAVYECDLLDEFPELSKKVWSYLERTQILSTEVSQNTPAFEGESAINRSKYYRHVSLGGWPFSTSAHGWPISDCTGEGLKGVLSLTHSKIVSESIKEGRLKPISRSRLEDAVNVLLMYQNEDGGWATYENNRGFGWYEQLNPSEVFGDIMIDYSYVECSMASLTALVEFHEMYPDHRAMDISAAVGRGKDFMKSIQREDGSWYGSWACCFTYGCWFGIEGLIKAGESNTCPEIQRCCAYLISKQRENGGWGEDFTSCYDKDYAVNGMKDYGDDGSGVVNTGWALLALSAAKCDDVAAIRKGVQYLMKRQLPCGDWPQEGIAGVFNRSCGITYTSYRNVFPIWALGRCVATYGDALNKEE
mmetsp:Transcript_17053/g.23413  ORF Transcript_17053/g.23413 Transcript_17053/m.23413 type:complete len:914 (+) Transcript_17053:394-3135(+)